MNKTEVVFCGKSVYLCGLAAGLQHLEQLRVRMVEDELEEALHELKMLAPDVVVSECLDPLRREDLFYKPPRPLWIGIDTRQDVLVVFTDEIPVHMPAEKLAWAILQYADMHSLDVI